MVRIMRGYWKYEHMAEQIEDAANVLKVMTREWDTQYETVFSLDYSQNHNKKKPYGLNIVRMNHSFGG